MPLTEDTVLENRYRIDGLLSYGGMGAVYRAYDTNLQVEVAIKENYFHTPQAIEQFKREALVLARLRHPALPRVLQHFTHEGQQYLVMEFVEGPNLWELIKRRSSSFSEPQALAWVDKVCAAVAYLHGQSPPIVHRDIKPQNIKVMSDGQVVLVDFGIAKEGDASARTATGARGVTPGFSPPEQYSGGGSSPVSDVYALGATLYALLTGVKPPDSVSLAIGEAEYVPPDHLNPSISPAVAEAITWAMQPRPGDRPQTVEEWRQRLRNITREAPPLPPADPAEVAPGKPVLDEAVLTPLSPPVEAEVPESAVPGVEGLVCPACGARSRPDVRFCEQCGERLALAPTPVKAAPEAQGPVCPACREQNRPGVRFCERCGASLVPPALESVGVAPALEKPTCPACGGQNRPGVRFCEECGRTLG
jgi:serine/threonine protein kinase